MARRLTPLSDLTSRQEIPFHLELPNPLVELGNEGLVLLLLTVLTTKDARSTLQQSPLPCADLARMKLVATGYLCRGLFFSQRFQGHLGLEGRAALPLSFRHLLPLPDKNRCPWFIEKDSHLATCRISWVHFRPLSIRIIGTLHSEQILARYGNIGVEDYKGISKKKLLNPTRDRREETMLIIGYGLNCTGTKTPFCWKMRGVCATLKPDGKSGTATLILAASLGLLEQVALLEQSHLPPSRGKGLFTLHCHCYENPF